MLPDDLCPTPPHSRPLPTTPHSPPLHLTTVWQCESPAQADQLLSGELEGYVYQRDRHPNADQFAEKCRLLHEADRAIAVSSGMAAMALFVLSQLRPQDHLIVSQQLYGRSLTLLKSEAARWGVSCALVDTSDLAAVEKAFSPQTRWIVVETIANPLLRVADLAGLAELAHAHGAKLLVDNTFASPAICRPLQSSADLILESVTKMMNGHSDATLGLLAGRADLWERVPGAASTWGLASSPLDCWLALRGLATLALRCERACENALQAAQFLSEQSEVERVDYPGLKCHPDHALASRQFGGRFGWMVAFHLRGGRAAADRFIGSGAIPFCPSLGEVSTTVSHPESTSHRGMTAEQRVALGISGGTLRLSVGCESAEHVRRLIRRGLDAI